MENCRAKARIVAEDEREADKRALLNFGHTFDHALEVETGFGDTLPREAVAMGMSLAFNLSVSLGLCLSDADRVRRHFAAVGLHYDLRPLDKGSFGQIVCPYVEGQKDGGWPKTFILSRGIGKAFVTVTLKWAQVLAVLVSTLAKWVSNISR